MPRLPSAKSSYEYKKVNTVKPNNNIVVISNVSVPNKGSVKHTN